MRKALFTVPTAFFADIQWRGGVRTLMCTLTLLDELEAALTTGTDARRIEMLTGITDLFIGGAPRFSEDQIGVFDDVMAQLVNTIEVEARAKLAHRLAPVANAPSNVIHLLAFADDIEVARPILIQSERFHESALLANASRMSQQHLFAITQRQALSEAVTDVLVERGDRQVVHSVAKNAGARFSDAGFHVLVRRSSGDDALAAAVGMRVDIPQPHFVMLLEKASREVRARLTAESPQASSAIEEARVTELVIEVVSGVRNEGRNASPDFADTPATAKQETRKLVLLAQAMAS